MIICIQLEGFVISGLVCRVNVQIYCIDWSPFDLITSIRLISVIWEGVLSDKIIILIIKDHRCQNIRDVFKTIRSHI